MDEARGSFLTKTKTSYLYMSVRLSVLFSRPSVCLSVCPPFTSFSVLITRTVKDTRHDSSFHLILLIRRDLECMIGKEDCNK